MAIPTATTLNYDPNLPVYAAPETQNTQTDLGILKPASSYVDESKATVSGQLSGILSSGSPLLRAAATQANQLSNAKGMLTSQSGMRSAMGAVVDKGLQIATPDAAMYGNMALQTQKTEQDAALNNQLAGIEYKKGLNNARITGALTAQEQAGQVELQKMSDTAQMQRLEVENQWKHMLNMDQMDSQEAQQLSTLAGSMGTEINGSIERILRDTNIENKPEAIRALMTQYRSNLSTAAAILNIDLNWS